MAGARLRSRSMGAIKPVHATPAVSALIEVERLIRHLDEQAMGQPPRCRPRCATNLISRALTKEFTPIKSRSPGVVKA